MVWPTECWAWGSLVVAVLCFIGLGVCGALLDKHGTDQCDFWRGTLLSVARDEPLDKVRLNFLHRPFAAYVTAFGFSLGAFLGMTFFFLSALRSK